VVVPTESPCPRLPGGYLIRRHAGSRLHPKGHLAPLLLLLILSSGAWIPLLSPGFPSTRTGGDSPFLLIRLDQLLRNLRAGVIPARWMPDAAYGLGYPFFNYYAALPYYLAAAMELWGWGPITALKLTQVFGFQASGIAMYALAQRIFRRRLSALLAAVAYIYAPFHLVNVYVRGDSLSEFYAFVWYPLLAWAILRLRDRTSTGNALLLGGTYAGLILTHNISALIATPIAAIYAVLLSLTDVASSRDQPLVRSRPSRTRFLLTGLAAALLGLSLSSWFWVPALMERDLVQLEGMTTGYFHFTGHFRGSGLVQRRWPFDYTVGRNETPFSMGLTQALLTGLASLAMMARALGRRQASAHGAFALILLLITTYCITPLSQPLWDHIPLLPLVQFPWRFLSVQSVFTSVLIGSLSEALPRPSSQLLGTHRARTTGNILIVAGLMLLLIASTLGDLRFERLSIGREDLAPDRLRLYEFFTANIGTTVRSEYLPRTVETRPFTSAVLLNRGQKPPPMAITGEVSDAYLLDIGPIREVWDITVVSPRAQVGFHTHYFPGWRAVLDGKPQVVYPVKGWGVIGTILPQGRHRVVLRLGRTPLRWTGELITLLSLFVSSVLMLQVLRRGDLNIGRCWRCRSRLVRRPCTSGLILCAVTVCAIGAGLHTSRQEPRQTPTTNPPSLDLSMDFIRQPYLHHNPDGVRFGDEARLLHYTLASSSIQAGQRLQIELAWDVSSGRELSATIRLLSPSKPLFDKAVIDVRNGVPLKAGETVHDLVVPLHAPPGLYLLMVELRDREESVDPLNGEGEGLGATYLQPVWVDEPTHERSTANGRIQFGDEVALVDVRTEHRTADRLYVHLTWEALRPIPANYNLSLRLSSPSGQTLSVRDLQPHYGFYPTSLWRVGVPVSDIPSLPVPVTALPGSGYALDVVLYRVSTLQPIVESTVGVHLAD
jgi:hypothetical protein